MKFTKRKSSGRRWTEAEIRKLCNMWPDYSVRTIKEAFKDRSWYAIRHVIEAAKLGPRFQGYVSVKEAARRLGYNPAWITRRIQEGEILGHRVGVGEKCRNVVVDLDELEAYVKRRSKLETWTSASARHHMHDTTLRRIYVKLGKFVPPKGIRAQPHLKPKEVDEVVTLWKSLTAEQKRALAAIRKAQATRSTVPLAGSIASQASSPMEPGNEHSPSCSDSASTIGRAA